MRILIFDRSTQRWQRRIQQKNYTRLNNTFIVSNILRKCMCLVSSRLVSFRVVSSLTHTECQKRISITSKTIIGCCENNQNKFKLKNVSNSSEGCHQIYPAQQKSYSIRTPWMHKSRIFPHYCCRGKLHRSTQSADWKLLKPQHLIFFYLQNYKEQFQPPIELIGSYDPMANERNEKYLAFNFDRIRYWLGEGAELSKPVAEILGKYIFIHMQFHI